MRRMEEKELFDFAYEVYYKAISLIEIKGQTMINIDDEIVKEIIKNHITKLSDGDAKI